MLPYHPSPQTHEGQGKASLLFNCACACVCLCTYACVHVPIPERGHRQRRFFYSIFPHSSICVHYGLIHVKPSIASFQYQNVGEQPLNSLKVTPGEEHPAHTICICKIALLQWKSTYTDSFPLTGVKGPCHHSVIATCLRTSPFITHFIFPISIHLMYEVVKARSPTSYTSKFAFFFSSP